MSLGHVDLGELAAGKKETHENLQNREESRGRSEDRMTLNSVRSNRLGRRLIRFWSHPRTTRHLSSRQTEKRASTEVS